MNQLVFDSALSNEPLLQVKYFVIFLSICECQFGALKYAIATSSSQYTIFIQSLDSLDIK
jgi:hypothetical protein